MKKNLLPLLLIALLSACATSTPNTAIPTPTLIETTDQVNPTSPPDGGDTPAPTQSAECRPNAGLLGGLRAVLPYEQAVLAPLAYGGETSLVVWFVSPALDSVPPDQAESAAISLAVQAAKALLAAGPCLEEYDSLSFSVTDSTYWLWFSGSIRVADIPDLTEEVSGGGSDDAQGGGVQPIAPTSGGSCTWADVSAQLTNRFYNTDNLAVFYYTREFGGSHVSAHWQAAATPDTAQMLETMQAMAAELGCLAPIPSGISATLTGPDGTLLVTAYLPLDTDGSPLVDQFNYTLLE